MASGKQSGGPVRQHHDLATGKAVNNRDDTRDLGGDMKCGGRVKKAKGGHMGKKSRC